jgi:glycosyltransferase involved in cell wall biosynthesis
VKIIFICTKSITFNKFLKSQADYLIKKGFEIKVACSDSDKLNIKKNIRYKINFPQKTSQLFNLINYIKIYEQIKNLVRENPKSIFYLHTPLASHLFRFFTFFYQLKIIYFVHGFRFTSTTNPIKNFFFKSIEQILSLKTDAYMTINNEDYKYAQFNLFKKSPCYKINGVGLNLTNKHFKKKILNKKGIKKILVVAAYKKDKGYFEILKLAQKLKNKNFHIDCYGYGNYNKFNLIKIKKKINNISFNKFDFNLEKKIKKFDILLHLSKREGLPVSVMQSLSAGLPVICYDIRGNNDLIKDNFNGYFVKSYKDVSNKLYYLNLENAIFNKMRNRAFKSINRSFSNKIINTKIYSIIKVHSNN